MVGGKGSGLHNCDQGHDRVDGILQRPDPLLQGDSGDHFINDRVTQLLLAVEMVVERAFGDACSVDDRVDVAALESRFVDLAERGLEQAFAGALGIAALYAADSRLRSS